MIINVQLDGPDSLSNYRDRVFTSVASTPPRTGYRCVWVMPMVNLPVDDTTEISRYFRRGVAWLLYRVQLFVKKASAG